MSMFSLLGGRVDVSLWLGARFIKHDKEFSKALP